MAGQGHNVTTVDYSLIGIQKTRQLADSFGVSVETVHADLGSYVFEKNKYDAIVCIFGHFPPLVRHAVHSQIYSALDEEGTVIIEAYSKEQLNYKTGGPADFDLLYSVDELRKDFSDFSDLEIHQVIREVNEGKFHKGIASVVQLLGVK